MKDSIYLTTQPHHKMVSQFTPFQRGLKRPGLLNRLRTQREIDRINREGYIEVHETAVHEAVITAQHEIATAGELQRLSREQEVEKVRAESVIEVQKGRNMATRTVSATATTHADAIYNALDQEIAILKERLERGDITQARFDHQSNFLNQVANDELTTNMSAKDISFDLVDRGLRAIMKPGGPR